MGFYSMASIPKHGDSIIEQASSQLGGDKFIASFQFQKFLDDLGTLFDEQSGSNNDQDLFSLSVRLGASSAKIEILGSDLEEVIEYITSVDADNKRLQAMIKSHIDSLADLEQVVYTS